MKLHMQTYAGTPERSLSTMMIDRSQKNISKDIRQMSFEPQTIQASLSNLRGQFKNEKGTKYSVLAGKRMVL